MKYKSMPKSRPKLVKDDFKFNRSKIKLCLSYSTDKTIFDIICVKIVVVIRFFIIISIDFVTTLGKQYNFIIYYKIIDNLKMKNVRK